MLHEYENYKNFEPLYELVKTNPNEAFNISIEELQRLSNKLSINNSVDKEDLFQQSYIYFLEACEKYNPYYNGGFIPFVKYMYPYVKTNLIAYIQKETKTIKREISSYLPLNEDTDKITPILEDDSLHRILVKELYEEINKLDDKHKQCLLLTLKGYKQHEIGEELGISQSRVSHIMKKIINKTPGGKNEFIINTIHELLEDYFL